MASASDTVYRVRTVYETDDGASNGIKAIGKEADRASKKTGMLKQALMGFAAFAGYKALGAAKGALIDFNVEMEQARIQMAGLMQLNVGGTFNANMSKASDLVGKLQQRAKKSVGTTQDMVEMASMITRPVLAAGLGMQDLEDITANATVAAKAFGMEAGQAALDIEQALMGTLGKKDRFARALLEPMGMDTTKFNALSAKERAKALADAMRQEGITKMAEAQAGSFAGVTSTLKDNIQMALGRVGLPLMQAITREVQKINRYFDENGEQLEAFADSAGKLLVDGFMVAKSVMTTIVENKDLLLTIAKAALAIKAARGIQGLLGSFWKGVAQHSKVFASTTATASSKLGAFAGAAGSAASMLGTLYVAAKAFADWVDRKQIEKQDEGVQSAGANRSAVSGYNAFVKRDYDTAAMRLRQLEIDKLVKIRDGKLSVNKNNAIFKGEGGAKALREVRMMERAWNDSGLGGAKLKSAFRDRQRRWKKYTDPEPKGKGDEEKDGKDNRPKGDTNVKVEITIPARDPDRFARDFNEAMKKVAVNPIAARNALRGVGGG